MPSRVDKEFSFRPIHYISFATALIIVLGLQFAQINRPFRGHFASYQSVMAKMGRNMVRENFSDLALPKTDSLFILPVRTYHLNQYPLPSLLAALGVKFIDGGFEFWGRFQAIIFNLLSVALIGMLAALWWGKVAGFLAALFFLISPFSVIYGQMFMSEAMSLCFFLLSIYLLERRRKDAPSFLDLLFSGLAFAIVLLGRIHYVLFLPALLYLVCRNNSKRFIVRASLFLIIVLAPTAAWYGFTYFVSMGSDMIRVHTSLFFQLGASVQTGANGILSLAFLKQLSKIFGVLMMTPVALPFVALGGWGIVKERKFAAFFGLVLAGCLLTILLVPQKLIDQGFYLYGALPFFVMAAARGFDGAMTYPAVRRIIWMVPLIYITLALRIAIPPLYFYSAEEKDILAVTAKARSVSSPDDIFILDGDGSAVASYYLDRMTYGFQPMPTSRSTSYFLNRPYDQESLKAIQLAESAMKNSITRLEYLRSRGARYFLMLGKPSLAFGSKLLPYLRSRYNEISTTTDSFYLFSL